MSFKQHKLKKTAPMAPKTEEQLKEQQMIFHGDKTPSQLSVIPVHQHLQSKKSRQVNMLGAGL